MGLERGPEGFGQNMQKIMAIWMQRKRQEVICLWTIDKGQTSQKEKKYMKGYEAAEK